MPSTTTLYDGGSPGRPDMMNKNFGYESVLRSHFRFLKTKADIVVLWLHWILLRNVFKSHGGEGGLTELLTEHLPRGLGWNGDKKSYLLKYEFDGRFYVLGVWLRQDSALLDVSLVTVERSVKVGIRVAAIVDGSMNLVFSNADPFTRQIEAEFVRPMMQQPSGADYYVGDSEDDGGVKVSDDGASYEPGQGFFNALGRNKEFSRCYLIDGDQATGQKP